MRVQLKVVMSGTRNGEAWPLPGGEIEVPDEEGANMCANGLATPVVVKEPVETATAKAQVESREVEKPTTRRAKAK